MKKILAFLLVLVMICSLLPLTSLADGNCTVSVYATVADLTFKNSDEQAVTPGINSSGGYQVYTLTDVPTGTYTFASAQYGTGVLKLSEDEDVYLRVVDFTFKEGGSSFYMKVTNTEDEDLVYTSPTVSTLSVKMLVPALGWGTDYRFDFCPEAGWCSFTGPLWVLEGTTNLEGFKAQGYQLSDGGAYLMGRETQVTFRVPTGAKLGVYELVKFYRSPLGFQTEYVSTEDEYDIYTATVATPAGGTYYYTVSKEGCITTSDVFEPSATTITVAPSDIEGSPNTQINQSYDASILTNGNYSKHISLQQGEDFAIWSSRAWQAIDGITSNRYVEPDKHYYVMSGDSVAVDDIGTVTAVREGTAIVAMTYDAMNYCDEFYSAIDSECVAVYVFTVGNNSNGIATGLIDNSDLDTHYVASTITIDGYEQPVSVNTSTAYTFTPTDDMGQSISVRVCTVSGYPTPDMSSWRTYEADANGNFTIDLYPGRNIVEVAAGDRAAYHVLNCRATNVSITNNSASGERLKQGESATVTFDNINLPLPKLGAIYNPGYGGTVYLEGTLISPSDETQTVCSQGVQYDLNENATFDITLSESGDYQLSGIRVHSGSFGSACDAHLALTRQSDGGNYTGGDAPAASGYFSFLPGLFFEAESADYEATAAAIRSLIDAIGSVEYTDECKEKIDAARKAYDSASSAVKTLITADQLAVLTDAETVYEQLEETNVAASIETRTVSGEEFYVLTDAAELKWFTKVVNGTLASGAAADSDANALLGGDITVNEAVLGDSFQLMAVNAEQWTPIGSAESPYTGIFDGDGNSINGIYMDAGQGTAAGLFASNAGTIRNLTVGDSYISASGYGTITRDVVIGGIAADNAADGLIENVTYHGYVGTDGEGAAVNAGGIAGCNDGEVNHCRLEGKVESAYRAGGIAGFVEGTLDHCVNTGTVSGDMAGGIAGILLNGGLITSCYCTPAAEVQGTEGAGGIVYCITDSSIASCYNTAAVAATAGEAAGIYCETVSLRVNATGVSYYLYGTASSGIIQGDVERKTSAHFSSGEVAYLLGSNYGQQLGTDAYPVFNDGSNGVFTVDGTYVNASAQAVDNLIEAIGTVAVDGSEDCFRSVTSAQNAYNSLPDDEKGNVTKTDILTQKLADYDGVVSQINGLIAALETITEESGPAIDEAKSAYQGYWTRGGDLSRISNAGRITEAEEEFFQYREAQIGANIETRAVDGEDFYILTTADELFWFARVVNGTLASGEPADTDANALLDNDIIVNSDLLDTILVSGVAIRQDLAAMQRNWTPIDTYSGVFDGLGHTISGIYLAVDNSNVSFFEELNGAIVRNLIIEDAYYDRGIAGFAEYMNGQSLLENCGFVGVLNGRLKSAGIVMNGNSGIVRNCYTRGTIRMQQDSGSSASYLGGIVGLLYGNITIENCYSACDFGSLGTTGGIIGLAGDFAPTLKNCYFETSDRVKDAVGNNRGAVDPSGMTACTMGQFALGEVTYNLGSAFGQDLGNDTYPEFNNGQNTVYRVDGSYYNRTFQVVSTLIDSIGNVALDGSENCFRKTMEAQEAFNALSASMQNAIDSDSRGQAAAGD